GLVAAALLQCLPVFVRVTADGLSEGPFLLFLASGLLFAVTGLRTRCAWRFLACGLSTGLAYLTRPEGGELAIATAAVVGVVRFRRRLRDDAGLWVLALLAALHAAVLWRMAVVIGYVSERHTLPLVLIGVFWAGAAIPEIGRLLGSVRALAGQGWPRFVPEL